MPNTVISLNVLPEEGKADHRVEQANPVDSNDAASVWIPEDISSSLANRHSMTTSEVEVKTKQEALNHVTIPTLRISGPNVIVADPSIVKLGIPLFADIKFKLWDKSK